MVGSLELACLPLGLAQREALRAARADFAPGALFARQLLAMKLRTVPLPLPQVTTVIYFSLWPDEAALERFRASSLPAWPAARRRLSLRLAPIQSFGTWRGVDPLGGHRSEPDPARPALLVTHSRTRPAAMPAFMLADRPVVRSLRGAPGHLWAGGFLDRVQSLDTGTLSLWRSLDDALRFAYRPGIHDEAVQAQRRRGWFTESWFARFQVLAASGDWPGLDPHALPRDAALPHHAGAAGQAPVPDCINLSTCQMDNSMRFGWVSGPSSELHHFVDLLDTQVDAVRDGRLGDAAA